MYRHNDFTNKQNQVACAHENRSVNMDVLKNIFK